MSLALRVARRAAHLDRAGALAGVRRRARLPPRRRRHAVHFDDQHRAGARAAPRLGRDAARRRAATRRRSARSSRARRRSASSADTARTAAATSAKRRLQRGLHRRLRHEPQRDLGDDRERAFGADQQLREVVADDVLDGSWSRCGRSRRSAARLRAPARSAWSCRTSPRAARRRTRRRCRRSTTASGSPDRADRTGRALRRPPAGRA